MSSGTAKQPVIMEAKRNAIWKKSLLAVVATLVSLGVADLGIQIAYRVAKGIYTWDTVEQFRIRGFAIRTQDTRYVTGKPSYSDANYEEEGKPWSVLLDEYGFRKGLHRLSFTDKNIVFLGDSVPFGWGVHDDHTVASRLHRYFMEKEILTRPIVNAALPSYSLDQAISRYAIEIHGRFPVNTIIIQVIDPISQFTMLGSDWSTDKNWTTYSRWGGRTKHIIHSFGPLRYSALFYFLKKVTFKEETETLNENDTVAFGHYREGIQQSLNRLDKLLQPEGIRLLLLSSNTPSDSRHKHSKPRQKATQALHKELANFASAHGYADYIDLEKHFAALDESALFIDDCCHLSLEGANLQAQIVGNAILKNSRNEMK